MRRRFEREVEADAARFEEDVRSGLSEFRPREEIDRYFDVFSAATDYRGVVRYLSKKAEARAPDES